MSIIRVQKTERYSIISNEVLNDPKLSYKAKGLLCYLLSKPDTWNIQVNQLVKASKDGRDAVYATIKELGEAGYIIKEVIKDASGKIVECAYTVFENPLPGNPDKGKPYKENPDISNTNSLVNTKSVVPSVPASASKKKKTALERKVGFMSMVIDWVSKNPNKYPKLMYNEFTRHWLEEGRGENPKLRFEAEKFFNIGKRLATWASKVNDKQLSSFWDEEKKIGSLNSLFKIQLGINEQGTDNKQKEGQG